MREGDQCQKNIGSPVLVDTVSRMQKDLAIFREENPAIFATALETLAVKAFGDMGQTARLRLIRDRFIACNSNCDLRRHLESVSPETPIREVVDRCRVWESHANPAVRRMSRPNMDPKYPGMIVMSEDGVPTRNIESPYGGGVQSLPGAAGNCLPVMCSTVPVPSAGGPQLDSWRVAVVRVEETLAGDASGPEFPRAETNRHRPIDLSDVA